MTKTALIVGGSSVAGRAWSIRKMIRSLQLLGLSLAVAGCTAFEPRSEAGGGGSPEAVGASAQDARIVAWTVPDLEAYRLRPGDVVRISVWNNDELSREVTIAPDGNMQFPFVGEIEAADLTLPDLESRLRDGLAPHIVSPQVSTSLTQLRSYRIYVTGEVTRPGAFDLHGPVSVVQAIAMAGGFTPFASRTDILLYNPVAEAAQRRRFDYTRFLADEAAQDVLMAPGDTLIVR